MLIGKFLYGKRIYWYFLLIMGQCLARQRSPPLFRRVQVQPVHPMSPPTSPPLPKVKFEIENEPTSSNDVGKFLSLFVARIH